MKVLKNTYAIVLLIFSYFNVQLSFAQNNCEQNLKIAMENYNKGCFFHVIDSLIPAISGCNYTISEREIAYKLLASSYLEIDELEKANDYIKDFLIKHPYYKVSADDPRIFETAINRFVVLPKLSLELEVGRNWTFPLYADKEDKPSILKYRSGSPNTLFDLGAQFFLNKNFSVKAGIGYRIQTYFKKINDTSQYQFEEETQRIEIPVRFKYGFNIYKKWSGAISLGVNYSYTFHSEFNVWTNGIIAAEAVVANKSRVKGNFGGFAGASLRYNHNNFSIYLKSQYVFDYNTLNIENERSFIEEKLVDYNYVDHAIKLRNLDMLIGFELRLFHEVKSKY
jgi:hypothetical protein